MAAYDDLHAHANSLISAINTAEHDWMAALQRTADHRQTLAQEQTQPLPDLASAITDIVKRNNCIATRLAELSNFKIGGYEIKPEYDIVYERVCRLYDHGLRGDPMEVLREAQAVDADLITLEKETSTLEKKLSEAFGDLRKQFAKIVEELVYEVDEDGGRFAEVGDDPASQYVAAFFAEMREYAMDEAGVRKAVLVMLEQLEKDMEELGIVAGVTHA